MKKFCSILILIVLLLNSSVMVLINQAVQAVSETITSEKDIQSTQEVKLEKYMNYVSGKEKGAMVQLKVEVGLEKEESEVYVNGRTITIECPKILEKMPNRVEVLERDSIYKDGIITIKETNSEKAKYEGKQEYTIILFYGEECYTDLQEERVLNAKVSVTQTIEKETEGKKETITVEGKAEIQETVTEKVGTIVSIKYETEKIYNGYIKSNIENGTAYDTEYNEITKIMISNKDIAETFTITSNNKFENQGNEIANNGNLLYKNIVIEKSKVDKILGQKGEIRILSESDEILGCINNTTKTNSEGQYVYTFERPVENIKMQIANVEKEGIIELKTTKIIKSSLAQEVKLVKNEINVVGTKIVETTEKDETTNEVIKKETEKIMYTANLKKDVAIYEAREKISMTTNVQELKNNVQNEVTVTATLEKNNPMNKLFENPTIDIELPEEVEKVILKDVQVLHDLELAKKEPIVGKNQTGKTIIRIPLEGKQTQYTQASISKGTNIIVTATVILKQDIETKDSIIKVKCNGNECEQAIRIIEKNNVTDTKPTTPSTGTENVEGTIVQKDGIKVDTKAIAGDKVLANNETVYEQQIIKYEVKVTNTTEQDIENVKIIGKIPEGMTYVNLEVGGYYGDNYDYIPDETIKQKEIEVGTLKAGKTETYYYEVKVNDITGTTKSITTEIKVYAGETEISTYTLASTINQANLAVELKGLQGRGARNEWIYFAQVSNISNQDQKDVEVNIPLSSNMQIESVNVWAEDGTYETKITGSNILVKFSNISKKTADDNVEDGMATGFQIGENEVGIYITAKVVNIEENADYTWNIKTVATAKSKEGIIYKSNENRASGYIEAVKVTQRLDKEGESLQKGDEVKYTFEIQNVGKVIPEVGEYTRINFKDYLPNELEITGLEYNTSEVKLVQREYTITPQNVKLSQLEIDQLNQKDNSTEPRVDLSINIPTQGKSTVTITAKVKNTIYVDSDIENYAIVTGENIKTKQSNIIKNTIKGNKTIIDNVDDVEPDEPLPEKPTAPVEPEKPTAPVEPEKPTTPVEPEKPTEPDEPTKPEPPVVPEEEKYTISGLAWIDDNENGQRESTEKKLSGVEVRLLDIDTNKYVQDEKGNIITRITNVNGQYSFTNIEKGKYYVVFRYDNEEYEVTTYKKPGISGTANSDAMQIKTTIDNKNEFVGLTDIIELEANKENIDIGLIKYKTFDLKVEQYVQKITVQTKKGTKQYEYNNEKLAKIEIPASQIEGATLVVEYKIVVTNVGELAGTVNELIDEMPSSLTFNSELNSDWYKTVGNNISNTNISTKEIKPGESIETTVVLTKVLDETIQTYTNIAKIGISDNIKHITDKNIENNSDKVDIIVSVKTGTAVGYVGTIIASVVILAVMLYLLLIITKKIQKNKRMKLMLFVALMVAVVPIFTMAPKSVSGDDKIEINITGGTKNNYVFNNGEFECNSPGLKQCSNGTHIYEKKDEIVEEEGSSITGDVDVSIEMKKTNPTVQMRQIGGRKIYGPFSYSATSSNGQTPSYELTVQGITDINTREVVDIEYSIVDSEGKEISVEPNKEMYISVPSNVKALVNVQVNAQVKASITRSYWRKGYEIWVCTYVDCSHCKTPGAMQIMKRPFEDSWDQPGEATATTSIQWTDLPKAVILEKVDYDNNVIKLENVKFRLGIVNSAGTMEYVKQNATDLSISYVTSKEEATIFVTNKDGEIMVEGLTRTGTYEFEETENQSHGYNNIKNVGRKTTINVGENSTVIRYLARNRKLTGNIELEKVNNKIESIKLENVEFVIKNQAGKYLQVAKDKEGIFEKSIKGTVNVTAQKFVDGIENATRFVTDSNGKIAINNIALEPVNDSMNNVEMKDFIIEEIYNPNHDYEVDPEYITWRVNGTNLSIQSASASIGVGNNETTNVVTLNKLKYVIVDVKKVDYDDNVTPLPNVGFVIKNDLFGYVKKENPSDQNEKATFVNKIEEATIFRTDANGHLVVDGLLNKGNYSIIEVENPNHGYGNIKNENVEHKIIESPDHLELIYTAKNKELKGDIELEKTNAENSEIKLSGVEFVLLDHTGTKYVKATGEGIVDNRGVGTVTIKKQEFVEKIEEATVFVTDENGKLHIKDLELYAVNTDMGDETTLDYIMREIRNPNYGFVADDPSYITWNVGGTANIGLESKFNVANKGTANLIVKNEQKYIRISGYVWEDIPEGKQNKRDDLYSESGDKLVEGIKVVLHNKTTGEAYETWTDSEGAYVFGSREGDTHSPDNILLRDIGNYYVEFIYNGMKYTNVILHMDKENGSKACESESDRKAFNEKFATITGKDPKDSNGETEGSALNVNKTITADIKYTEPEEYVSKVTYTEGKEYADKNNQVKLNDYYAVDKYHIPASTDASGYALKTTYVPGMEEIKNVNLGIYEREQVDLSIASDIEKVQVSLHGYTHTYNYATRNKFLKNDGAFNVGVKFGDKYVDRYSRTIYQSSVAYFAEDSDNHKLEVEVTYKITMKNESTTLTAIFEQINNYYDKEYTPQEVYYMSGESKTTITNWNLDGKTYAEGKVKALEIKFPDQYVDVGETVQFYITYKVSDEAVLGLLNKDATLSNMTEIVAYSTFTSDHEHYASIDEDSASGNVDVKLDEDKKFDQTTFEDDTDQAPSLILQADKNNIISGTVFEDSQTETSKNENERLGNGIYEQESENVVVNAKVELLVAYDENDDVTEDLYGTIKLDDDGNPVIAKLYQFRTKDDGTREQIKVDAVTTTDENGNYELKGLIPDGYVVRYTYGEGTQIKEEDTFRDIDVIEYKSTIITSNDIRKALKINPDIALIDGRGNYNWNTIQDKYSNGDVIRYSDAVDEIEERMKQEEGVINYTTINNIPTTDMRARTATFIVGVEFENINGAANVYEIDTDGNVVVDENGEPKIDPNFYTENRYMDFGIILRPIVDLSLDKNITNMAIQLANGQILVNGNPYEDELPYTRAVDDEVYVDMDSDKIQGASLNIQYEVKLINNSEVDYKYTTLDEVGTAGRKYYYFGDSKDAERTQYVNLVGDYLDNELYYDINEVISEGWKISTVQELFDEGLISEEVKEKLIAGNYNIFTTKEFNEGLEASSDPNKAISKTLRFNTSKLLGVKDELVFTNDVEILELHASARRYTKNSMPGNLVPEQAKESDEDSVSLTILPPTGANNNYTTYVAIVICSLVTIGVGVIFIRKRILK